MTDVRDGRAPRKRVSRTRTTAVRNGVAADRVDRLATEDPLEIRVHGPGQEPEALAVTMRTPGDDFELAAGFLFTEGLIAGREDVESVAYCVGPGGRQEYNVVTVALRRAWDASVVKRNFYATSSCGVCGKAAIDQIEVRCDPVAAGPTVDRGLLSVLPERLRDAQKVFAETGGLHAAGLFTSRGDLVAVREDVGRHNAFDKLVGWALLGGRLPLADHLVMVSGRASFELVQKAAVAGAPVFAAVSAPSSLAVDTADRFGMTLVGFLRGDSFNVYTRPERVELEA